jgi:hypothetical protein
VLGTTTLSCSLLAVRHRRVRQVRDLEQQRVDLRRELAVALLERA